jgi:hypothetical protein
VWSVPGLVVVEALDAQYLHGSCLQRQSCRRCRHQSCHHVLLRTHMACRWVRVVCSTLAEKHADGMGVYVKGVLLCTGESRASLSVLESAVLEAQWWHLLAPDIAAVQSLV